MIMLSTIASYLLGSSINQQTSQQISSNDAIREESVRIDDNEWIVVDTSSSGTKTDSPIVRSRHNSWNESSNESDYDYDSDILPESENKLDDIEERVETAQCRKECRVLKHKKGRQASHGMKLCIRR
ncbi:hypothetical protein PPYR_10809 [Photinus pyralis]|uniref:Uncharacterized protein n=1 Tax=Photinus pyralis TaxID=7054 RepID=A0A1Y1JRG8_PHOPY|nr:uncharacterized protein LOC116173069 [Photinus pyralis]KAB0796748.1 hypothetical protein PPYR_10809 [Photinus pyralis]